MAAAVVKSLVFVYLLLNVCHCSPTTELLETVTRLLNDCARFYPQADLNNKTQQDLHQMSLTWAVLRYQIQTCH